MTGYTVHTGASKKFVSGWDRIFSGSGSDKAEASSDETKKKSKGKKAAGRKKKKS